VSGGRSRRQRQRWARETAACHRTTTREATARRPAHGNGNSTPGARGRQQRSLIGEHQEAAGATPATDTTLGVRVLRGYTCGRGRASRRWGELVEKRTADLWRRAAAANVAGDGRGGGRRHERARVRRQEVDEKENKREWGSAGRFVVLTRSGWGILGLPVRAFGPAHKPNG
jgi:hypothetical protein